MGEGFKTGDRVQFADAKGQTIRGRVVATRGANLGVRFQRGWAWRNGVREPKSDYVWSFSPTGLMHGFEHEVSIQIIAKAVSQ